MIRGLGFLFDGAPDEILVQSGVRESLSQALDQQGKGLARSLSLWRPVARQPNQLSSFLAMSREDFLPRLLDVDSLKEHFDVDEATDLFTTLERLQRRPADLWALLEFPGGSGQLDGTERESVVRALSKVGFSSEFETNVKLPELIMATCQQATALGDAAIKHDLRRELFKLAAFAASRPATDQAQQCNRSRLGGAVLDAVWNLNVVPGKPASTASAFLSDTVAILGAWPALAAEYWRSLTSLVTQLPIDCQFGWIPLQLELRALG